MTQPRKMRIKATSPNPHSLSSEDACCSCKCYADLEELYRNVTVASGISEGLTYSMSQHL